jgi:hypothetical protein
MMMMNKLHVLALTGLVFCGINNASMGQEQREVLYALHTLGQNFADVPMIVQNIDMFAGVLEMNIQINEAKLKVANQKIKTTIMNSAAIIGGTLIGKLAFFHVIDKYMTKSWDDAFIFNLRNMLINSASICAWMGQWFTVLNIHDVWKNRSALMESLALDKEILSKLEEIKVSMDFIEENSDSTDNFLLNSVE